MSNNIHYWTGPLKQEISANAHEMRDSISLISYAGCFGLFPVILAKISSIFGDFGAVVLKCVSQPEIVNISLKTAILDFKVVQGHRCWYSRKGRQQCLL